MGLFNRQCVICNRDIAKTKISDGFVCKDCFGKCGKFSPSKPHKLLTSSEIQEAINMNNNNNDLFESFNCTKNIGGYIKFDDNKKLWFVKKITFGDNTNPIVYKYDDIINYELLEDGELITKGA